MTPREHRRQRVGALTEAGLSARSIARELGVDRATVGRDLVRAGLKQTASRRQDRQTMPSGRDRAFHDALWEHVEHLHLRGLADTHVTKRRQEVERLEAFLGHSPLTATLAELQRWARALPRNTPQSRYAAISHVRSFYGWCLEFEHLSSDPARKLPHPKLPRMLPRPMSEDDLKRAIDNADGRVRVWLVLAAYAGLRCIEIAALYRHDILDGADPPVLIAHGKGNKDRAVPMCQRVIDELRAYGLPRRGPLFPRLDGRPGPTGAHRVSDILSQHFAELGIDGRAHTLRHRFGTETYRASQDIRVVQELLGHDSPSTTARYAAYSRQRAVDAVRMLDRTG